MWRAFVRSALALAGWCFAPRPAIAAPSPPGCERVQCVELATIVRRAGDRVPLSDVRVLVVPERRRAPGEVPASAHLRESDGEPAWMRQAASAADGRVVVADVPLGRVRVVAIADGFARLERVIDLGQGKRVPPLFVRELDQNPYRTIVTPTPEVVAPPAQPTTRTLARNEIRTAPGSQGDPLRAVQNLPGVARAPAGAGLLVLRGAPPGQSRVFLGEHSVPRAFHVLGFTSVIPADVIDTLELIPGNFPARYGDALGGVIVMHPRTARRDGVHGFAKVDLTSAGAMIETPIKRAGLFVAAQRGYVDQVLRLAEKVDETVVFALPRYYDYQAQLDVPFRGGQELVARVIGSGDRWTSRIIDFMGNREEVLELSDQFHRAELVWRARRGPWRVLVTPAFRVDARKTKAQYGSQKFRGYVTSWRAEVERRLSRRAAVLLGVDGEVMPFKQSSDPFIDGSSTESLSGYNATVGAYASATMMFGPVTLWPGVRASAYARRLDDGEPTTRSHAIDPRLLARFEPNDRWTLDAGVGSYSQVAPLSGSGSSGVLDGNSSLGGGVVVLPASARAAIDPGIGVGDLNRRTTTNRALQGSLGAAWHDSHGLEIGGTGFVRWYEELRSGQRAFDRTGLGSPYPYEASVLTYGLELLVRKRLGNRLYAWAAYTLLRSQTRTPQTPASIGGITPGNYDQRHNLVLIASYALPRGFRIGGRFRFVSGSPFTPVVGVLMADNGRQPVNGAANSARFPVFHQLDLRLDKSWVLRRSVVITYVDVQNVYNHRNVEAYIYALDFRDRTGQVGLPIFPTIGVRVEW